MPSGINVPLGLLPESSDSTPNPCATPGGGGLAKPMPAHRGLLALGFRERFYTRPRPLLITPEGTIPGASLWNGSRCWVKHFREAGLKPGDRVLVSLDAEPAMVMVLIAALWEGLTLAIAPTQDDHEALVEELDCRGWVSRKKGATFLATGAGIPDERLKPLRSPNHPGDIAVKMMLRTSGTTGPGRWIAISEDNLTHTIAQHLQAIAMPAQATAISVLPWHHSFGLIIDLWHALWTSAMVIRDPSGGRDPESLVQLIEQYEWPSVGMVPIQAERLAAARGGEAALAKLIGGVIGGAPVSRDLAQTLAITQLRAGYGQTEASPGVCLGQPGAWEPGYLGEPIGCEVRLSEHGELSYRGTNTCYGHWSDDGLVVHPKGQWTASGDLAAPAQNHPGYIYRGRMSEGFKLGNGKMLHPHEHERQLREALGLAGEVACLSDERGGLVVLLEAELEASKELLDQVQELLGGVGAWVSEVQIRPAQSLPKSRKGTLDRRALSLKAQGRILAA